MANENNANQTERFKQAARELGCEDGEALEHAFGKIVPPKRRSNSAPAPEPKKKPIRGE